MHLPLHKKWSFPLRISLVNVSKTADLVAFIEKILNGKFHSCRVILWRTYFLQVLKQFYHLICSMFFPCLRQTKPVFSPFWVWHLIYILHIFLGSNFWQNLAVNCFNFLWVRFVVLLRIMPCWVQNAWNHFTENLRYFSFGKERPFFYLTLFCHAMQRCW